MGDIRIDGHLACSDEAAQAGARLLRWKKAFLPVTQPVQVHAAIELLKRRERGSTIGFLVCDSGLKYLSTSLYP